MEAGSCHPVNLQTFMFPPTSWEQGYGVEQVAVPQAQIALQVTVEPWSVLVAQVNYRQPWRNSAYANGIASISMT